MRIHRAARAAMGSALALCVVLGAPPTGLGAGAPARTTERWQWPTAPPGTIVEPFQAPATHYAAGHRGVDVAASAGEPVVAPTAGTIRFAGVVVDRPVITLQIDDHVLASFEPVTSELPVGTAVAAGQRIGVVAGGAHCDGRCLHLGVRVDGEYVSPLLFLAGVPPAVLLPLD